MYKYVLHHPRNVLPKVYLETIAVYMTLLNQRAYCLEHHYAGMGRLPQDDALPAAVRAALERRSPGGAFEGRVLAGLQYAEKLTTNASALIGKDVEALREAGCEDGEILEINQVASCFTYADRMVLVLSIDTEGDIIGLSPGDSSDPESWSHR